MSDIKDVMMVTSYGENYFQFIDRKFLDHSLLGNELEIAAATLQTHDLTSIADDDPYTS